MAAKGEGSSARAAVRGGWLKRAAFALLVLLALPYVLALLYLFVPPPSVPMMVHWLRGETVDRRWVPLEEISPALVAAVIVSEDARFCAHWGIDPGAIRDALRQADESGRSARGASTISMQTAKNLFLWNDRSMVRKALELPLAAYLDLVWPKERILEAYLNIAEWGPGVFGAEAAARRHFGVPARNLTPAQARLLATALPNPIRRAAGRPSALHTRLAERLRIRMERGGVDLSCVWLGSKGQ